MNCPDHDELTVGACDTCGREICEICLEDADSPEDFECPECGEYGVTMHDDGYPDMHENEEEEEPRYRL